MFAQRSRVILLALVPIAVVSFLALGKGAAIDTATPAAAQISTHMMLPPATPVGGDGWDPIVSKERSQSNVYSYRKFVKKRHSRPDRPSERQAVVQRPIPLILGISF